MSEFSEYLDHLIKCRGLKHVQAAEICKIDTSTIFRWANGKVLPKSWERLEPIVKKLRLTPYEVSVLKNTYEKELLGESQSQCFEEIMKIFHILEQRQGKRREMAPGAEVAGFFGKQEEDPERKGKAGHGEVLRLQGRMEVWRHIQNILEQSFFQMDQKLYLKLYDISDVLLMQLKEFCGKKGGGRINILICGGDGTAGRVEVKLKRMRKIVDLLFQKGEVCIYYLEALDGIAWEGQNWMMSDDFFLQFTNDMSKGMMARDTEWIAFFREYIERMEERRLPIHKDTVEIMEYVGRANIEEGEQIASVEHMPCISMGLTEEILREQICQDLPFREKIIQKIIEEYPNGILGIGRLFSYFTKEGLTEFMESGRVEIFPYKVYKPLTMEQRCEILGNLIALAEQPSIHFFLLKEGVLSLKGLHVEQRSGAKDSLWIEIQSEDGKKEEIDIADRDIQQAFKGFLSYLRKSGNVYKEMDTLAYLKEVLSAYQKREIQVP